MGKIFFFLNYVAELKSSGGKMRQPCKLFGEAEIFLGQAISLHVLCTSFFVQELKPPVFFFFKLYLELMPWDMRLC